MLVGFPRFLLSVRGGDRRPQDKLLDCLCERCKPLSILSTVQSASRSASSAIWFKIAAFALSGSASASRRYRRARTWFLGVMGRADGAAEFEPNLQKPAECLLLAPNRLAPAFRRGPLLRVDRKSLALVQNDVIDPFQTFGNGANKCDEPPFLHIVVL
jgi:hypothetical protein